MLRVASDRSRMEPSTRNCTHGFHLLGRGALRAFELTFEHRWIYVFELVQNALDAGARSIAFRLSDDGDTLTFQHDGRKPIDERDVEGLWLTDA